jgi:hypothetical protein
LAAGMPVCNATMAVRPPIAAKDPIPCALVI